jgi:hypothetical protein
MVGGRHGCPLRDVGAPLGLLVEVVTVLAWVM